MTGYSSIGTAIDSIRSGAFDYLTKPFKLAEIEILANKILEYRALVDDNRKLAARLAFVTEKSVSIDQRLDKIEALLSTIAAKLPF
jgi:DNA-binding NtrC family response regulator